MKCLFLLFWFAVLSLGFSLYAAVTFAQDGQIDEWIAFKGTATLDQVGLFYLLYGADGGALIVFKDYMRVEGSGIEVKVGYLLQLPLLLKIVAIGKMHV